MIWVERSGQNSIVVASGANHALAASEVEAMRATFRGARVALFQLESSLDTVERAMKLAREEGVRTILDPAPAQALRPDVLAAVDILTPNETEASMLLGEQPRRISADEGPAIARRLRELGPQAVILKLGEQGCVYVDDSREIYSAGFRVEARDTTAAGDIFNGALAAALVEGVSIDAALRFANAAAAISVTRVGAQASVPSRAEVDRFLKG